MPVVLRGMGATPWGTPQPTTTPQPSSTSTPQPSASLPTLLKSYVIFGPQPDYEQVRYRPRQFAANLDLDLSAATLTVNNPGPYIGWDVLNAPNDGINRILDLNKWLDLTLQRPAMVAIAWRAGTILPAWMKGWTRSADVVIDGDVTPTYLRSLPAGKHTLGSIYDPDAPNRIPRDTFLVLFAEQDSRPSSTPTTPAGREAPQANATCPTWVHEQYVATGPDGKPYPTWHPPIDPVFWCYFHHEHGSDPSPHRPLFGYVAAQHTMEEAHQGFKVYKFHASNGVDVIVTHHFGTGNAVKAVCARFHTFDLAAYRNGILVADLHLMADHGKAIHARTDAVLRPSACPNQAAEVDAEGSTGARKFQISTMNPVAYEPWQMDFTRIIVGYTGVIGINTPSRITDCNSLACDQNVPTGDQGEFRFASYGSGFGIEAGARSGVFYTDVEGRTYLSEGDHGAVRQFIAAGERITLPPLAADDHECYITDPFGGPYVCQADNLLDSNLNVEGSLRSPN
jgi:hypothetical protein